LNADDMAENGLKGGDLLDITSHYYSNGKEELRPAPPFGAGSYEIPRRCAATYFPEANVLVPIDSVALRSNTPTSKAIVVSFAPTSATVEPIREASLAGAATTCTEPVI